MLNSLTRMKLKFLSNHPKFAFFVKNIFSRKIEAGTIIEITVKRPGENPITSNIKVTESDIELFENVKDIIKK